MKLLICGDLCVTKNSLPIFADADEKRAFSDVLSLFGSADRVIVNLECALTESENAIAKCGPNLKGPHSTADTLRAAGVTDCMLSNNHTFDFGKEGFYDTVKNLDRVGICHTGWGENYEDSRRDLVIEKNGVRISIVNVCEHEYSYALDNRVGARPFDEFETMEDIRRAKRVSDHVIVIYHGGKEQCMYPSPRLLKACREMIRCGAGAVLCQHSHCIGAYEKFEGGHILYGQGNFHFVGYFDRDGAEEWNEGLAVMFEASKESLDISFEAVKGEEHGGIRLADPEEKEKIMTAFEKRNSEILDGSWKKGWLDFVKSSEKNYMRVLGYADGISEKYYQRVAHYIDCEAHRDVVMEIFKTYNHTNELD